MPCRVAFCITELDRGGAELLLLELVRRIDRKRFDPVVYCLGPRPVGNPTSLADEIEQLGVPVYALAAQSIWQAPSILQNLRRRLREDRPAILHSHLFHANLLGTIAGRLERVPHILVTTHVAEHDARWHLTLARWTKRWVERYVCVSHDVARFTERELRLRPGECVAILNGVDTARFANVAPLPLESLGIAPGRQIFLFVGRLARQKGLSSFLDLLPRVFAAAPSYDFVIAGAGPDADALKRQAIALGTQHRVHFLGFRHDIPALLAACDAVVMPSLWEGLPLVLLEAMAAGKPLVANRVEGVTETLGPLVEQQSVPLGDLDAFAGRLIALLSDRQLAAHLGEENRRRATEHFDFGPWAEAYQRLYDELLAGG